MTTKRLLAVFFIAVFSCASAAAQTTAFTFQGSLQTNGAPATGNYDFEFALFDAVSGGTQLGTTVSSNNLAVANGVFSVSLDFGGQFPGATRFLEIRIRAAGGGGFTLLSPRQPVASSPYSVKSLSADSATNAVNATNASTAGTATNAATATNSLLLGGVAANQYVLTGDPRLSDARNPLPGNANYIQNTTSPQALSNFSISGNGTAGGTLTGNVVSATTQYNIGGARVLSSPGSFNFFAGNGAGQLNSTGISNSFFGVNAGVFNTTGGSNAFFGFEAGRNNNSGTNNAYFGKDAGRINNTGSDNAFFGNDAGDTNTTGINNTIIGSAADVASNNLSFATAIGSGAVAPFSNAIALGRSDGSDKVVIPGNVSANRVNTATTYTVGIDTTNGVTVLSNVGTNNIFVGVSAGLINSGIENSFFGRNAGDQNTGGDANSFFGKDAGRANGNGNNNTIIGSRADIDISNRSFATAVGAGAIVTASNRIQLGRNGTDTVSIGALTGATATHVCINGTILANCTSSIRYKQNVRLFGGGLDLIRRLRPVTFDWKEREETDIGLIAEDVETVHPLLVTYNKDGDIQGVKYDQISVVLINAVKEQQAQIEYQAKEIAVQKEINLRLQKQVNLLTRIICKSNPSDEVCREEK